MPNNYFRFKQFTIYQDKCAMKVSTDACLLGALVDVDLNPLSILDIGTGTGVLALMTAQKFNHAKIESVEINDAAYAQAIENIAASKWKNNITIHHQSIQQFAQTTNHCFNLIISNPPYFEGDLKSQNQQINIAKHSQHLSLIDLIKCAEKLLAPEGKFIFLLPVNRIIELQQNLFGLSIHQISYIKDTINKKPKRCIITVSKVNATIKEKEVVIKEELGNYTKQFTDLLQPYYLFLK
jgi:tRNA1Val (adenine37-N6)-methyltransferase